MPCPSAFKFSGGSIYIIGLLARGLLNICLIHFNQRVEVLMTWKFERHSVLNKKMIGLAMQSAAKTIKLSAITCGFI